MAQRIHVFEAVDVDIDIRRDKTKRETGIMNASDVLIESLMEWGVDVVFGLPGDGINGIMESLRTHQDKIRFIHVRHEEAAAFMACGYAKYTGKLGVCLATSGPGGIHLLNGLYDAKMDGAPVLAITGLQFHDLIGTHTQQDVELDKLFMDVCVFNQRIMGAAHVANVAESRAAPRFRITVLHTLRSPWISKSRKSVEARGLNAISKIIPARLERRAFGSLLRMNFNSRQTFSIAAKKPRYSLVAAHWEQGPR